MSKVLAVQACGPEFVKSWTWQYGSVSPTLRRQRQADPGVTLAEPSSQSVSFIEETLSQKSRE